MIIKMRESKGFTLVELMIVVAIIGILAAVAVPYYQRYVAKSRLTSLVFPGVHAIENALTTRYAVAGSLPADIADLRAHALASDADLSYIGTIAWTRTFASTGDLSITVSKTAGGNKFGSIEKNTFKAEARPCDTSRMGTLCWKYSGDLATELGL